MTSSLSRMASLTRSSSLSAVSHSAQLARCRLYKEQKNAYFAVSSNGQTIKMKLKHLERVERWSSSVKPGFTLHLDDMRQLEVETESVEACNLWIDHVYRFWHPTLTPIVLRALCIDDLSESLMAEAEFTITPAAMKDPEKFAARKLVQLHPAGRLELRLHYTSNEAMIREIFQACDPVKLLFGMFVLWVNWYSFNVGSTNKVTGGGVETAGRAAVVTTIAAAAGAVTSMVVSDCSHHYLEPEALVTGVLSALVSITASCAVVTEAEALAIGCIGALIGLAAQKWELRMQIDDPCSAFPVHGAAGLWGVLSVGIFAQPEPCMRDALRMGESVELQGLFRGGGGRLLGVQALAALCIIVWSAATSFVILVTMQQLAKRFELFRWLKLRPSKALEEQGFDRTEHNIRRAHHHGHDDDDHTEAF